MALGIRTNKYRRVPAGGRSTIDGLPVINIKGRTFYVDGTSGSNSNTGATPADAWSTLTYALTKVSQFDVIYLIAKRMAATDTDPGSYAEAVTISTPQVSIIGLSDNRTQGGLPQLKVGSGSSPIITVSAPGVYLSNLGINGASATGGGILLNDDGGSTAAAFGTTIENCHFKNCVGSTATDSRTGGAIMWSANGAAWQVRIKGNLFYKNVGGIVLKGTGVDVPQDVVIEDNVFAGPPSAVDCDIYGAGGSGFGVGLMIMRNYFQALPALGSGSVVRFMDLTGADGGIVAHNFFGTGTVNAFGASGSQAKIPTTVFVVGNWGQSATGVTIS